MNKEEAIKAIQDFMGWFKKDKPIYKSLQMAIQALSQEPMREFTEEEAKAYSKALDKIYKPTGFNVFNEPCDAISREDAIKAQCEACDICGNARYTKCQYFMQGCNEVKCLRDLPSVTQKSGEWIIDREVVDKSRKPTTFYFDTHCSECGFKYAYTTDKEDSIPTNYCPNCGARMESEK